ncbi:hypothetical protein L1987_06373 [Smallanthus sonchifolius]|uniref:Uncharacterized protein n=1 Tax=Smallanthus sonchifolius TaxID=185202 RepID=A0ACB9JY75_9ASTR|nr:hypothetical protein L1987_06373 [Smallanthus sonchifolius]
MVIHCPPGIRHFKASFGDSIAPLQNSKFDRFSLQRKLPYALNFAKLHLERRKMLVVYCNSGGNVDC